VLDTLAYATIGDSRFTFYQDQYKQVDSLKGLGQASDYMSDVIPDTNAVTAAVATMRTSKAHRLLWRSEYGSRRTRSRVGGVGGTVLRDAACDRSEVLRALVGLTDEYVAAVAE